MSHLRRMNLRPPTLAQLRAMVYGNHRGTNRLLKAMQAEKQLTEYGLAYGRLRIAQMYGAEDVEEPEWAGVGMAGRGAAMNTERIPMRDLKPGDEFRLLAVLPFLTVERIKPANVGKRRFVGIMTREDPILISEDGNRIVERVTRGSAQ